MDKLFKKNTKFRSVSGNTKEAVRLAKEIIKKNKETIELLRH